MTNCEWELQVNNYTFNQSTEDDLIRIAKESPEPTIYDYFHNRTANNLSGDDFALVRQELYEQYDTLCSLHSICSFSSNDIRPRVEIFNGLQKFFERLPFFEPMNNTILCSTRSLSTLYNHNLDKSTVLKFFMLHEYGHSLVMQDTAQFGSARLRPVITDLLSLYNKVKLKNQNGVFDLDVSRIHGEILPDFLAVYWMMLMAHIQNKPLNLRLFIAKFIMQNKAVIQKNVFFQDLHAPIEARLVISFIVANKVITGC